MMSRSVKDLCRNVVTSLAFYNILASMLLSMNYSNSSNILSIFFISSKFELMRETLVINFCSSFLYLFSNSNFISYFLSSNFLARSQKPLSMFFICWNLSLFNSSLTQSISFQFSSFSLWAFTNIFYRSRTFYFKLLAISSIWMRS